MIISNKLIKGFIFACLLPVFIGYASETTSPQKDSPAPTINGQLLDSTTLKPIKNAEVQINLMMLREKKTYDNVQRTNEEGRYSFEEIPSHYVGKDFIASFKLKKIEGRNDFSCMYFISKEDSKKPALTYNFKLMKPTDEVAVKIKALNVVDKSPLNKIVVKLQGYSKEKAQFVDFKEGLTDEKGIYEVKTPWIYQESPSHKSFLPGVGGNDYSIVIKEVGYHKIARKVTDQKIETSDDYSEYGGNLYLADSKKTPTVNCVLTNNDGKPLINTPVTVKLGESKG